MASILSQPSYCIRIHRRCCFNTLRFFSSKPFASHSNSHHHFSHRPIRKTFALDVSRSFSQSHHLLNTDAPTLHHFIAQASLIASQPPPEVLPSDAPVAGISSKGRIYHETFGCQMNINDMEIVLSIMKNAGYTETVEVPESAEIIFINTCAIRDNAEQKVWQRLNYFWFLKRRWKGNVDIGRSHSLHPPKVVVWWC